MSEERSPTRRVLIVDDNVRLLELLREQMEGMDVGVDVAPSGDHAAEMLREAAYDVVVSDIQMPGMDGLELLSHVRGTYPQTEFIIMTGYASIETAVSAVNLGAHSYIQKPFVLREVQLAIERAMERRDLLLERERLIDELQQRVEELHAAQKQIVSAQDKLLQAERVRTYAELLVGLNHQINNLVMGITSAVACARRAHRQGRADAVEEDLEAVEDGAMRITSLLERAQSMEDVPTVDYVGDTRMVDLDRVTNGRAPGEQGQGTEDPVASPGSAPRRGDPPTPRP